MAAAEAAAREWLDALARELPTRWQSDLRQRNVPRKRNPELPPGVSLSSSRNANGARSLRYQVLWHDGAKRRIKQFGFGIAGEIDEVRQRHALAAALKFRRAYESRRRHQSAPMTD